MLARLIERIRAGTLCPAGVPAVDVVCPWDADAFAHVCTAVHTTPTLPTDDALLALSDWTASVYRRLLQFCSKRALRRLVHVACPLRGLHGVSIPNMVRDADAIATTRIWRFAASLRPYYDGSSVPLLAAEHAR